ncbi:MAG: serine/threonine-protein kinase [Chitinophagales bacterium]
MKVSIQEFRKTYLFDDQKDFLGKGGFGEVYKAFSKIRGEYVVLKFYNGQVSKYDVISEIKKAIKLEHPNLIRYYSGYDVEFLSGEVKQTAVMEYANGGDLKNLLRSMKNPLDRESLLKIKKIVRGILKGLAFLGDNNIIHRDIKPENLLIHITGENPNDFIIKIGDFGLASQVQKRLVLVKEKKIDLVGTPAYMAPEIFSNDYSVLNEYGQPQISLNADLWALGMLVYFIFKRQLPFGVINTATTYFQIRNNILHNPIPTNFDLIPQPYRTIVEQCLIRDAKKRVRRSQDLFGLVGLQNEDHKKSLPFIKPIIKPIVIKTTQINDEKTPSIKTGKIIKISKSKQKITIKPKK